MIHVQGGTVSARRKPGAEVVFNTLITRDVADLSPEVLAAILAQGIPRARPKWVSDFKNPPTHTHATRAIARALRSPSALG